MPKAHVYKNKKTGQYVIPVTGELGSDYEVDDRMSNYLFSGLDEINKHMDILVEGVVKTYVIEPRGHIVKLDDGREVRVGMEPFTAFFASKYLVPIGTRVKVALIPSNLDEGYIIDGYTLDKEDRLWKYTNPCPFPGMELPDFPHDQPIPDDIINPPPMPAPLPPDKLFQLGHRLDLPKGYPMPMPGPPADPENPFSDK